MATRTGTPQKRTAAPAARKAAAPKAATPVEVEETDIEADDTVEETSREQFELTDKGRTKGGEGKERYFNIHERGVRGQIFTDANVIGVKLLVIYGENEE